jgi:predicted RNA-binding Zn ribbon-like protein
MQRLVEGKPAPMPLLSVQAFANTLDVEEEVDRLESLDSWRTWLKEMGLIAPGAKLTSSQLRDARKLRELLRELLAANEQDRPAGMRTGRIAELAGVSDVPLTSGSGGRLELDLAPARDARTWFAQLAGIVHQAQLDGSWGRLKLCENDECLWAFYDSSRNRSGSWCRMGECGNRLKNRAYRARQRSSHS